MIAQSTHSPVRPSLWMPRKICYPSSATLYRRVPTSVRSVYDSLREAGWRFYVTESTHGYCHQDKQVITIPLSLLGGSTEIITYMICHEIAHALTPIDAPSHGVEFLENFKSITPRNLWYMLSPSNLTI